MQRSLCSFVVSLALILALVCGLHRSVIAQSPGSYSITSLGTLGGAWSRAYGINDSGQVVGISTNSNGVQRAFLWDAVHGMIDLGAGDTSWAYGINSEGYVVGQGSDGLGFVWEPTAPNGVTGTYYHLTSNLGGKTSCAFAINDFYEFVGYGTTAAGATRAMIYTLSQGMFDMGAGDGSQANSINSSGIACGSGGPYSGFYWEPTSLRALTGVISPLYDNLGGYPYAASINDSNYVTGSTSHGFFTNNTIIYDPSQGMFPIAAGISGGYAINNSNQIVGNASNSSESGFAWFPTTNNDTGTVVQLSNLLDASGAGWTWFLPLAINNKGWIAGGGVLSNNIVAFIMKPSNVAQVATDRIYFQSSGQSLWGPGQGDFPFNFNLGPQWPNESGHGGPPYFDPSFDPCFGFFGGCSIDLGQFGLGISWSTQGLTPTSTPLAQLQFNADVKAGSVDVTYPIAVKLQFPDRGSVYKGSTFTVHSSYVLDGSAAMGTKPPTASARLDFVAQAQNSLIFNAEAFGDTLINAQLLPGFMQNINYDYNIFDTGNLLSSSQYADFALPTSDEPLVTGYVKMPQLSASGVQDPNNPGQLAAHAEDTFFSVSGHITDWISEAFGIPLKGELTANAGSVASGILDYDLLDFQVGANLRLHQDFQFAPAPLVTLQASQSVNWIDPSNGAHTGTTITFNAGQSIQITMPSSPGMLTLTPTFQLNNTFTNKTSIVVDPDINFVPIEISGSGNAFGWDLGSFDFKPWDLPINSGSFTVTLYSNTFTLGGFTPVTSAPISVVGRDYPAPILTDVTPTAGTLFIAEATNPEPSDLQNFDTFAQGVTTVTFGGNNFQTSGMQVFLNYYGGTLTLTPSVTSAISMQVNVPNTALLLPGVARFSCTAPNTAGPSNTLDFPITFPVPNIQTVGPNLWASDPNFGNILITVEDHGIPSYSQTYPIPSYSFLSRGDYFSVLASTLWPNAFPPPAATAQTTFPNFPWAGVAPLPTIYWNGQALKSFKEPVASGLLWSVLPVAAYAMPQSGSAYIVSPGPGGGRSNSVPYYVGGLTPEITSLQPGATNPGGNGFRMVVKGPDTLPIPTDSSHFGGNFNAASQVLWNGAARPTHFISSSELHADISASDIAVGAINTLQVYNPGAAEITPGVTSDYSNPVNFVVQNPAPTLSHLQPAVVPTADPNFQNVSGSLANNLTVQGSGFVSNSLVYMGATALITSFVSSTALQASVPASAVAQPGSLAITVVNPAPGGGTSAAAALPVSNAVPGTTPDTLQVSAAAAYSGSTRITLQEGGPAFTLLVQGSGFCPTSVVNWNGTSEPTTFLSWDVLSASIPAAAIAQVGAFPVTVTNPSPGGGTSQSVLVPVYGAGNTPVLIGLTLAPISVIGGGKVTGKVTLKSAALAGGALVALNSNTSAITPPAYVAIPAGASSQSFTVQTGPVVSITSGTVQAVLGPHIKSAFLTVNPPVLSSLSLSPATVKGGKSVTGTVKLTGITAVPIVITLTNTNSDASVPSSVTIMPGTSSVTFTITTRTPQGAGNAVGKVTATLGSISRSATLTVTH